MSARESIAEALEKFQANWDQMMSGRRSKEEKALLIAHQIHFFSYVVLLERLRRHDEAEADRWVKWLDETIEDGAGPGEWAYQWQQEMARGWRLSMPDLTEETS